MDLAIYGPFRLDQSGQLWRDKVPIGKPLPPKERTFLAVLMSLQGQLAPYQAFRDKGVSEPVYTAHQTKVALGQPYGQHIQNVPALGYRFELKTRDLVGRMVHFAGSGIKHLDTAHKLVQALVGKMMVLGAGFVVSAGGEPQVGGKSQIFDWTVLESACGLLHTTPWFGPGPRLVNVHADPIAPSREKLWNTLLASGQVEHFHLDPTPRIGDQIEEIQASFGDILVVLGGRLGAEMLADRYRRQGKHVIPLDVDVGRRSGSRRQFAAALSLREQALKEHCQGWYSLRQDSSKSAVAQLELATARDTTSTEAVADRIVELLLDLAPPYCLVVSGSADPQAQVWCDSIAAPVLREFGFEVRQVEARTITDSDMFRRSTLTVVDLTGGDPYCLLQAGATLGAGVPYIWSSREDSSPPFEPVFRWSLAAERRRNNIDSFREHVRRYLARRRTAQASRITV